MKLEGHNQSERLRPYSPDNPKYWVERESFTDNIEKVLTGKFIFADVLIKDIENYIVKSQSSHLELPNWATEEMINSLARAELKNILERIQKLMKGGHSEAVQDWTVSLASRTRSYLEDGRLGENDVVEVEKRLAELRMDNSTSLGTNSPHA